MTADLELANRLAVLESVIERGIGAWNDAGAAVRVVRDERIYRDSYATFEDWARERWGWSRSRAYQMIEAADAVSTIVDIPGAPPIANEAQAREVAAIIKTDGPERAAEILTEVAEDGPVTAKAIREAARPTREVTTSETVTVDAETGEIVDAVERFATSGADMRRANLRKGFSAWMSHLCQHHLHDPIEMAEVYPELAEDAPFIRDGLAAFFDAYLTEVESNRRPRLIKES